MRSPRPTPPPGASSARVVLARRWEDLEASLVAEFTQPPTDVFAIEQVIVSGAGLRRMVPQALAAHGVVAGIDFVPAGSFWRGLQADILGVEPATDPWRSRNLCVPLMHLLDEIAEQPWAEPLRHHLARPDRPERRFATADRIARLFLRYTQRVPDMIEAWDQGRLVGPQGRSLASDEVWQAHLWTALVAQLGGDHPARRHQRLLAALEELPRSPLRLGVVVTTAVPLGQRQILGALARTRPVTIWQLAVTEQAEHGPGGAPGGPVLNGFGATQRVAVDRWRDEGFSVHPAPSSPSAHRPTLLHLVQTHLEAATSTDEAPRTAHPDGSITLHESHGLDRQVEVLREVLCGLFADDPSLEPREVVVVCPDPGAIAALVQADLGPVSAPSAHPGHQLRVQVARDAMAWPQPAQQLLLDLLRLRWARASAQDLLDLCSLSVVRARFDFDDDDLSTLRRLVHQADVRWGVDLAHRSRWGLDAVGQGTWAAGMDRILMSTALDADPPTWMGTATPIGMVESTEIELAGTLAEVVSRVRKVTLGFQPAPVALWGARLNEALDLLAAPPRDADWALQPVRSALGDLMANPATGNLTAAEIAALLETRPMATTRPAFGNGGLQVCGLADLDGLAHRAVIVIGLDDERFPPRGEPTGDDLTAGLPLDPLTDPRSVARQRLLNAVMAARDRLVVIYQGRDERTNEAREPTVPVLALRSAIATVLDHEPTRGGITFHHTLQPHSASNFMSDADAEPMSFDHLALAGLGAQQAQRDHPTPAPVPWAQRLAGPPAQSPPAAAGPVRLTDLVAFFRHPARELIRRATGVSMHEWRDDLPDSLPVELRGLAEYQVGNRLLGDLLHGADPAEALRAEHLRGSAPPGALGTARLQRTMSVATRLARTVETKRSEGPAHLVDIDLQIPLAAGPVRLMGELTVHGHLVIDFQFARVKGAHLCSAWLQLLALAAARPDQRWTSCLIRSWGVHNLTAPPPDQAVAILTRWVELWHQGQDQVVLLPPGAMAAYTGLVVPFGSDQEPPMTRADREWRRERDEDWALLSPVDFTDLWATNLPDGRSLPPVATELWDDLRVATQGGDRR